MFVIRGYNGYVRILIEGVPNLENKYMSFQLFQIHVPAVASEKANMLLVSSPLSTSC